MLPIRPLVEEWPERCAGGDHPLVSGTIVGWDPCGCIPGRGGHRTYWCRQCGHVTAVPPCSREGIATPDALGLARPGWGGF